MTKIKIGDVIEIPLSNGKVAYGQYLFQSKLGPIIQIFDIFSVSIENIPEIVSAPRLFPPIIVGLFAAIKNKIWNVIGNSPVTDFVHPVFVSTEWDKNGNATYWYYWEGNEYYKIGKELPDGFKNCEFLIVYPPKMVRDRIEKSEIPFPYSDLIKNNKFSPRQRG